MINTIDKNSPVSTDVAGDGAKELRDLKKVIKDSFPNLDKKINHDSKSFNHVKDISDKIAIDKPVTGVPDKALLINKNGKYVEHFKGVIGGIYAFKFSQSEIDIIYPGAFQICDGSAISENSIYKKLLSGSDIAITTVPDMRDRVVRMKGANFATGDLGEKQDDDIKSHDHGYQYRDYVGANAGRPGYNKWIGDHSQVWVPSTIVYSQAPATKTFKKVKTSITGGSETRVKATILNYFIRIN